MEWNAYIMESQVYDGGEQRETDRYVALAVVNPRKATPPIDLPVQVVERKGDTPEEASERLNRAIAEIGT